MPHVRVKHGPRLAHDVAAGRLDLDNVGAIVAEHEAGIGPHDHGGQVENQDAGKVRSLLPQAQDFLAGSDRLRGHAFDI